MGLARSVVLVAGVVALAGCHPRRLGEPGGVGFARHPLTVAGRLTCPDRVKDLVRSAQAPDGRTCAYEGPEQEAVQLSLTPLDGGTPADRFTALDQTLRAEVPAAVGAAGEGVYVGEDDKGKQAHIDLPGFHLNATDGKASIRMPGVSINADGDDADVTTGVAGAGRSSVRAHGGGAEIRTGGVNANGADVTYLLASDTPGPNGYRMVGYMAKGPAAGPLVVGVFRVRGHGHHDTTRRDGLARLIDMNVAG